MLEKSENMWSSQPEDLGSAIMCTMNKFSVTRDKLHALGKATEDS